MKSGTRPLAPPRTVGRKLWTAVFRVSAGMLICCMVAIVGFTPTVGYSWVYWVAAGSAVVCAVSATILRKYRSEEAAGDAAWLLGHRERGSRNLLDLDIDD